MLEGLVSAESSMDMSVLERLKWLQQQQLVSQSSNNSPELLQILQFHGSNNDELLQSNTFSNFQMLGSGFGPNYNMGFGPQHEAMDGCISRTSSCHMEPVDTMGVLLKNNTLKKKRKSEVC